MGKEYNYEFMFTQRKIHEKILVTAMTTEVVVNNQEGSNKELWLEIKKMRFILQRNISNEFAKALFVEYRFCSALSSGSRGQEYATRYCA